jgi:hypothetical protein
MHRRKFLALTGLATVAISIPGLGYIASSAKDAGVNLIVDRFHYLNLDKKGVEQFVEEYITIESAHSKQLDFRLRSAHLLGLKAHQSYTVNNLTELYLFSTDFFRNKMDESKVVKYVAYYNPFKIPCANPFSAMYYPAMPA